ncbi:hypothetical protein DIPPA_30105 [Diplonema papillatum]|nr:hypothetical protein DIPPA_30105 [Diplonema papillatum]
MYTKLPHDEVKRRVGSTVDEAYDYEEKHGHNDLTRRAKQQGKKTFNFGKGANNSNRNYTREEVNALLNFVIDNAYVEEGDSDRQEASQWEETQVRS